MTIAKALKEKNKLTTRLSKLWQKIYSHNSAIVGSEKPYDLDDVWAQIQDTMQKIVDLKTRIHNASSPVRDKIFLLSELKTHATHLSTINTSKGKTRSYGTEPDQIEAHFDIVWKDQQIELTEAQIEATQEELDRFNHTTLI